MRTSTAVGNVAITQGDGNGDLAKVRGVTAGSTIPASPYVIPLFGNVTITQGNGYADDAVLDKDVVNNVNIGQGNNVLTPGVTPAAEVARDQ